ncbi:MAG TPA: GspE/PulE family protein [Candidatus Paceibacterota bacterium]|nr:GspE/PulE family protein [Candidatus Paceibacterota bacterium]
MPVEFDEDKQNRKLGEIKEKEEEDLARILAERDGLQYIDLSPIPVNMDALRTVPEKEAREANLAPFSIIGKHLSIAVVSAQNKKAQDLISKLTDQGYDIKIAVASIKGLEKIWARYVDLSFSTETKAGAFDISSGEIEKFMSQVKSIEDVKKIVNEIIHLKRGVRISKILEIVLSGAFAIDASDIHIEPEETGVRMRYRLDGVLTDILNFDHETFNLLLSRIKLLSGLKLNVKNEAQDGRFSVKISNSEMEIRTSILPGAYDESIVMRILNPKSIQVPLEELGIPENLLVILNHEISRPNGMILTTGPTGSGKTTTLYAFLKKVYSPEIKIITIEDPIEYHLNGIVQTQTNGDKGYNFAGGLRSALRQDPDVIMVGEIRDSETAGVAVNASLTGHLVFSTLHTNSAAGTYPRLSDLGIDTKIMTSAINLALAQRLVRKLCQNCKKQVPVEGSAKKIIDETVAGIKNRDFVKGIDTSKMYQSVGCAVCNNLGYKGRTGIYEAIKTDTSLEKILRTNPSDHEIEAATREQGIMNMREDGILKVLKGITSFDELGRVIELEDEM